MHWVKTGEGDVWQATLMTNDGQKRENFAVSKFSEAAAKSMAVAQRRKWLASVRHLAVGRTVRSCLCCDEVFGRRMVYKGGLV